MGCEQILLGKKTKKRKNMASKTKQSVVRRTTKLGNKITITKTITVSKPKKK
jgi:hypothetical protein